MTQKFTNKFLLDTCYLAYRFALDATGKPHNKSEKVRRLTPKMEKELGRRLAKIWMTKTDKPKLDSFKFGYRGGEGKDVQTFKNLFGDRSTYYGEVKGQKVFWVNSDGTRVPADASYTRCRVEHYIRSGTWGKLKPE